MLVKKYSEVTPWQGLSEIEVLLADENWCGFLSTTDKVLSLPAFNHNDDIFDKEQNKNSY